MFQVRQEGQEGPARSFLEYKAVCSEVARVLDDFTISLERRNSHHLIH